MIIVGIGEYAVTDIYDETIITHALGSCVAFIVRCPESKKTALAHIVLPEAERREQYNYLVLKPGYFADIIIPKLLNEFVHNASCGKDQLQVTIVGGADARNPNDVFRIGARNVEKIKQCLRQHSIKPINYDIGGTVSRTVKVHVEDGRVEIRKQNMLI